MITRKQLAQIADVQLEEPATEEEIMQAERALGCKFPAGYKELLMASNGLFIGGHRSFSLYSTGELQERNETYEVTEYAPQGWLLIGDDGGGNGILLDCASSEGTIYRAGLGSLQRADAELIAPRLAEWAGNRLDLPDGHDVDYPTMVDVWLLRPPVGGPKGLIRLKSALNMQMSILELRRCLDALPCRVLTDVPLKYARLAAEYNATDPCLRLSEVDRPDQPVQIPDWANMRMPAEVRQLTEQAHAAMLADPRHRLPPLERERIYLSMGPHNDPLAQRRRGWLGMIAARFVLPLWQKAMPGNDLAERLLDAAEKVLRGQLDPEEARDQASEGFDELEKMGIITEEAPHGTEWVVGLLAGEAADTALYEVIGVHTFDEPWTKEGDTDETALDPWCMDASLWASDAYAGGMWDNDSDPRKRKEYWEWWLFEAIAKAWRVGSSE